MKQTKFIKTERKRIILKKKNMSIKYNSLHIKTKYTLKIHVTTQQKQLKHTIHTYIHIRDILL